MAIPQRSAVPGTYFVTSATWNRRRLFQLSEDASLFLGTLQHYRKLGHYKLHAFVVMPDHIHLLLTPTGLTLERVIGLIKGGFSHRMHATMPVWQRGFADRRMRNRDEFEARRMYIHANPVRAGIVPHAEDYAFFSAFKVLLTSQPLSG